MPVTGVRWAEEHPGFEGHATGIVKRPPAFERRERSRIEQENVALRPLEIDLHSFVRIEIERTVDEITHGLSSFAVNACLTDLTSSSGPDIVMERCSMSAPDTLRIISL